MVISGTRIPVERISFLLGQKYDIDFLVSEYPQVGEEKMFGVVSRLMGVGIDTLKKTQESKTTPASR